ncbi:MAG TPA: hypothetical protein PK504_08985 [Ferruginibacter sp.]|nr:hypothetical protein [Ferruginibacter sp.]HRE64620.1 hypothetical protein [Ferruginibacter sp.]
MSKDPQDDSPVLLMVKYVFPPNSTLARPVNLSTKKRIQIKYYVNQLKAMFNYCNKIDEWDYEALDYAGYSFKKIIKRYNSKCK